MGFLDDFKKQMKEAYEDGKQKGKERGSFEYQKQKMEDKLNEKAEKRQYEKERLQQLKRDKIPYCPKCKSTHLTHVNKKLSLGRTVVGGIIGGAVTGGLGAAGATLGGLSSKDGKIKCLNCGHTWKL